MNEIIFTPSLNWLVTFIASFLFWLMIFLLLFFYGFKRKIKLEILVKAVLSVSIAYLISELIKYFIPSIRPFKINGYPPLTITVPSGSSFPSSHSSAAFALAVSLLIYKPDFGFAFLLGALTVAAGRILANVHYFLDVLGGAFLGSVVAFFINRFYPKKSKRK